MAHREMLGAETLKSIGNRVKIVIAPESERPFHFNINDLRECPYDDCIIFFGGGEGGQDLGPIARPVLAGERRRPELARAGRAPG